MRNLWPQCRAALGLPLAALVLLAPIAWAESPLTDRDVSAVIDTMRDLQPVMDKHRDALAEYAKTLDGKDTNPDQCAVTADVRNSPGFSDMEAVIRRHGFSGPEAWCRLTSRVVDAFAAVQLDAHLPQIEKQVAEMTKQVESDTSLSPEQKQQVLARIKAQTAFEKYRAVPAADKKAVAARQADFEKLFDEDAPPR